MFSRGKGDPGDWGKGGNSPLKEYNQEIIAQLISQYNILDQQNIPDEIQNIFKALKDKQSNGTLCPLDGYVGEDALLRVMPLEQLRRAAWIIRHRYKYTVGEKVYEAYIKSGPPDPSSAGENTLRADLVKLLSDNRRVETFRRSIEKTRYRIANITGFTSLAMLLIMLCVLYIKTRLYPALSMEFTPLMFVCVAGSLGGLLSTTQKILSAKIWSESIEKFFEFQRSLISWLFLPPILGVLFAVILFLLFSADLLNGVLFPDITTTLPTALYPATDFKDLAVPQKALAFIKYTSPVSAVDYGKMIVWSFIAGFSQRFVPDTLSRLIKESDSPKRK